MEEVNEIVYFESEEINLPANFYEKANVEKCKKNIQKTDKIKKPTAAKKVTVKEPIKKEVEPKWADLFWLLSDTGTYLLRGLTKRNDIPEDVIDTIRAVIALRDSKDMFFVEQDNLTIEKAMFWSEELKKYCK